MKLFENIPLSNYTTMQVGGPAKYLLIPENKEELLEALIGVHSSDTPYAVIGNGSNLLVDDNGFNGMVILNTTACCDLISDSMITAGSSVKLQQLVRFCVNQNRYGMEYLYSIPGTVGGAIFMNAGRGKAHRTAIADNLVYVNIFDGHQQHRLTKKECCFKYRSSVFHRYPHWTILSAVFDLPYQSTEIGESQIKKRVELTRNLHDLQYPNAGSVFKSGFRLTEQLKGYRIGDAIFSHKTSNWICNIGHATSADIKKLITHARRSLKNGFPRPQLEWIDLNDYYRVGNYEWINKLKAALRPLLFRRRRFF